MKTISNRRGSSSTASTTLEDISKTAGSQSGSVKVEESVLKERKVYTDIAIALSKHSEAYATLMGAVNVCEGYIWNGLKTSFGEGEDAKKELEALAQSVGLGSCMLGRYILLVKKLISTKRLDARTQVLLDEAIEQGEIPLEVIEKVADKIGRGKTMTDLMREVGILPDRVTRPNAPKKVAVDKRMKGLLSQIEDRTKQVTDLVKGFEAVKTSPDLLAIVHKSGGDWIEKLDTLMHELRDSLDRIQIASIVERSEPELTREEIRQRNAAADTEAADTVQV